MIPIRRLSSNLFLQPRRRLEQRVRSTAEGLHAPAQRDDLLGLYLGVRNRRGVEVSAPREPRGRADLRKGESVSEAAAGVVLERTRETKSRAVALSW